MSMQELRLRVPDTDREIVEKLGAEEIGPNRFRLLQTPGVIEGIAAGDEIEVAPDLGFKMIRRGGTIGVWFFLEQPGQNKGPAGTKLKSEVDRIGGALDGGGVASLVFTIPLAVGFPAVEEVMSKACKDNPGSSWMYCNVYDPKDGETPLNWWLE